ncbi:MAG: hypothetical protein Q4F23_05805 [Coriobacteriia bacterium]|nr:hypothetical protein [Coriobacteriia bacterium]
MQKRIAHAVEMVTYAETVGPDATTKLPPVRVREYTDGEGKPLNPADPVAPDALEGRGLEGLPTIGSGDPYLTMPIQRIVDDSAKVIFDSDTRAKTYSQPLPEKFNPVPLLVSIIVVLLVAVCILSYLLFVR